ncbi:MAG: polyphosphate kinase 1 [Agriterribacter sp.]
MAGFTYFNRDISWLLFNERVLNEAANEQAPLMERIKFLSIYSSNLDEFYRVRIPAIQAIRKIRKKEANDDVYNRITEIIHRQQEQFGQILNTQLIPALQQKGYYFLNNDPVPSQFTQLVSNYFFNRVAGYLHPVELQKRTDFFPENNRLYLVVVVQYATKPEQLFIVNVPANHISRFYSIEHAAGTYIVFLEEVIRHNLDHLFEGADIKGAYNIKVTRDAELNLQDEYDEDLAEKIETQLGKRDHGLATRFLYEPGIPLKHLQQIIQTFSLQNASIVEGGKHHNLKDIAGLPVTDPSLFYPFWPDVNALAITGTTLLDRVARQDYIVHTPYQSYDTVVRFFNEAAISASVTDIYVTLYRVASHSRIVHALINAARNGKKVTVLVELKARFDEANNIYWSKQMKAAGVKIIYSSNSLKVHAKIALIKRTDEQQPYIGLLATGNLNETTARFYTDHILLTAQQAMLGEIEKLFSFLSKKKNPDATDAVTFNHILVAQFNLLQEFIRCIDVEIANAKAGLPASVTIKLNNLEEETLIGKLYEASNAGVTINLIVRGICRLVAGVANQSANITVKRIIDRYLEHGRVFIFHNNGNKKIFLGSSDWMNRNIYRRIEVCFPVYDEQIRKEILTIIDLQWRDNVQAVYITGNQTNEPVEKTGEPVRSQEAIYHYLHSRNHEISKEQTAHELYPL